MQASRGLRIGVHICVAILLKVANELAKASHSLLAGQGPKVIPFNASVYKLLLAIKHSTLCCTKFKKQVSGFQKVSNLIA